VPELGKKLVVVVAAHQVVRYRHADGRRRRQVAIGSLREALEPLADQRVNLGQPLDNVRGLDVDHPQTRIGLLVLGDDPQCGGELFACGQACGRVGHGALEGQPFPHRERVEQILLGVEPAIERRPRHPRLHRDFGKTELAPAIAAEHFGGGGQDPLTGGVVGVHHDSFTNFRRTVTLLG
jgi:hypothetical protein